MNFHKKTFEYISEEKKDRIFTAAIKEFAEKGFSAANVNVIAKKAGVSVGSLYSYFHSKEDLFLAMVKIGIGIMKRAIKELVGQEGTLDEILERLLRLTIRYTHSHPDLTKLYLTLSTEELLPLSERLAQNMELGFRDFYMEILSKAKKQEEIPEDTDLAMTAFFIDNLIILLQFSYSTGYYRKRMEAYLGAKAEDSEEVVIQGILERIKRSIHGK